MTLRTIEFSMSNELFERLNQHTNALKLNTASFIAGVLKDFFEENPKDAWPFEDRTGERIDCTTTMPEPLALQLDAYAAKSRGTQGSVIVEALERFFQNRPALTAPPTPDSPVEVLELNLGQRRKIEKPLFYDEVVASRSVQTSDLVKHIPKPSFLEAVELEPINPQPNPGLGPKVSESLSPVVDAAAAATAAAAAAQDEVFRHSMVRLESAKRALLAREAAETVARANADKWPGKRLIDDIAEKVARHDLNERIRVNKAAVEVAQVRLKDLGESRGFWQKRFRVTTPAMIEQQNIIAHVGSTYRDEERITSALAALPSDEAVALQNLCEGVEASRRCLTGTKAEIDGAVRMAMAATSSAKSVVSTALTDAQACYRGTTMDVAEKEAVVAERLRQVEKVRAMEAKLKLHVTLSTERPQSQSRGLSL